MSLQETWQPVIYSLSLWHAQHKWRGCVFSKICIHNKTATDAKRQRRMICESREIFFHPFFSLTTFFHPSPNLSTYIICLYNIYHIVALNAFTRDNICKRLFFLRRDAALGFNKTGHFSGDHLGISKEICLWLRKKYPNKSSTQKTFFIYATFFDLQEYLQMINEVIPVLHKTNKNIKLYT